MDTRLRQLDALCQAATSDSARPTDNSHRVHQGIHIKEASIYLNEGYNLHIHAEAALPDQVLQIVDPSSLEEDNLTEETDDRRAIQHELQRRVECIGTVISVGVSCSNHLPQERMKIVDARNMLQSARENLLSSRNRRNLPARGA